MLNLNDIKYSLNFCCYTHFDMIIAHAIITNELADRRGSRTFPPGHPPRTFPRPFLPT